MPDDRLFQPERRHCRHQPGTDAVCMNQIRLGVDHLLPQLPDNVPERVQVPNDIIGPPGEARLQPVDGFSAHSGFIREMMKRAFGRTNQDRVELASIETFHQRQQQPFGAADLTGMVVEKNLHYELRS